MRFGRGWETGRGLKLFALACGLVLLAFGQKKKDVTQTLQLPRELPSAVTGETRRLTFHVTPLSSKGLLSKQVRDALSALNHETHGDAVLKIRAFVAGAGDGRRVRDIISEVFTDHKLALPVLSLVQAGGLPEEAQVVLEAIGAARKEVNPLGLAFIAAHSEAADDPTAQVLPLARKSLNAFDLAVKGAGSQPSDVVRVSCFLSSLDEVAAIRKLVSGEYPAAAANFVQTQRSPAHGLAACEGVARLRRDTGAPLTILHPQGAAPEVALVASPSVVLTGTQVSFGFEEKDARLAFQRVQKELAQEGATMHDVAFAHFYPLASGIAAQVEKVRQEFFDPARPPATSLLLFEGLPSMNAGFAMDAVAVKPPPAGQFP